MTEITESPLPAANVDEAVETAVTEIEAPSSEAKPAPSYTLESSPLFNEAAKAATADGLEPGSPAWFDAIRKTIRSKSKKEAPLRTSHRPQATKPDTGRSRPQRDDSTVPYRFLAGILISTMRHHRRQAIPKNRQPIAFDYQTALNYYTIMLHAPMAAGSADYVVSNLLAYPDKAKAVVGSQAAVDTLVAAIPEKTSQAERSKLLSSIEVMSSRAAEDQIEMHGVLTIPVDVHDANPGLTLASALPRYLEAQEALKGKTRAAVHPQTIYFYGMPLNEAILSAYMNRFWDGVFPPEFIIL